MTSSISKDGRIRAGGRADERDRDIGELVDLVDGIFVDLVAKALGGNLDAEDLRRARFAVSEFVADAKAERQPSTPNTARS